MQTREKTNKQNKNPIEPEKNISSRNLNEKRKSSVKYKNMRLDM